MLESALQEKQKYRDVDDLLTGRMGTKRGEFLNEIISVWLDLTACDALPGYPAPGMEQALRIRKPELRNT